MTALEIKTSTVAHGRRYPIRPNGHTELTQDECEKFVHQHPVIVENAPVWARAIEIVEIFDDGEASFFYVFRDDRFEVLESWYIEADCLLTYGHNNDDEPEITSSDDALLELVTAYIEGKDQ